MLDALMSEAQELLLERVLNLFSSVEKQRYAQEVYALLQRSYRRAGGLHAKGFESPQTMTSDKIPMWKIVRKGDKIVAAVLYKDKNGRKISALGTDGTAEGKYSLRDMLSHELDRSYVEVDEFVFNYLKDIYGSNISKYIIPSDSVSSIIGEPIDKIDKHWYRRKIGSGMHTKIALGTPGKHLRK